MRSASILFCLAFNACVAQTSQNNGKMERFDIYEFGKHQVAGSYNRILDDHTQINQFGDSSGYVENRIPAKGWFYLHMEFYGNGNLKAKGNLFKKGDFKAGIWVKYDKDGNKTDETNYDKPYRLSVDSVIEIARKEHIIFSLVDPYNTIHRGIEKGILGWVIEWKAKPDRMEWLEINDASGKIVKRDFMKFEENH
jgi:hypothetical protein